MSTRIRLPSRNPRAYTNSTNDEATSMEDFSSVEIITHSSTNLERLTNRYAAMLTPKMFEHTAEAATLSVVKYNWGSEGIEALRILHEGKNLLLCGPAGSGKTTLVMQFLITQLLEGRLPPVGLRPKHEYIEERCTPEHKVLKPGSPAFIACALAHKVKQRLMQEFPPHYTYTHGGVTYNVSVTNNIMTAHRACEYKPMKVEVENDEGELFEKRRFMPTRGEFNKLPDIKLLIIDEGGMLPLQTFHPLVTACPDAQVVIMSDIGQLGAVANISALEPALAYGNAIELKTVYRNQGAILEFAFSVRRGEHYPLKRTRKLQHYVRKDGTVDSSISFLCYEQSGEDDPKTEVTEEFANAHCTKLLFQLITNDYFVPGVDMCICPQRPSSSGKSLTDDGDGKVRFGINAIHPALMQMLDVHYGRHTYCISTKKGLMIVAAGDIYYVDSEQGGQLEYMLLGLTENKNYVSSIRRPAKRYSTRIPHIWEKMRVEELQQNSINSMPTDTLDIADYIDDILDNSLESQAIDSSEEATSQWTLHLVNLTALRTAVFSKVANKEDAYTLLRFIVKELFNMAVLMDSNQHTNGYALTPQYIESELNALLKRIHLDSYRQDNVDNDDTSESLLMVINRTSKIAAMLPAVPITVHKAQGSESETVVVLLHNKCRQQSREMLYTAITRARKNLIVVCNANTFGKAVSDADGSVIDTSKYRTASIDKVDTIGISLEEKAATVRERLDRILLTGDDTQKILIQWAKEYFEEK